MLKKVRRTQTGSSGETFAIIASRYNAKYVDGMLNAARRCLLQAGARQVKVIRVPGAYEIPVVAARVARLSRQAREGEGSWAPVSAILCLGVILRGATPHAQHIGEAVSHALSQVQVLHEIPVIHEVLLFENEEQARVRCLDRKHNRGTEAAQTALAMAQVMRGLK